MSFGRGELNIVQNPPFASDIFNELKNEAVVPPPAIGFLQQEDLFYILQEDGNFIEIT